MIFVSIIGSLYWSSDKGDWGDRKKEKEREKIVQRGGRAVPWKEVQEVLADLKIIYDDEQRYKRIENLGGKLKLPDNRIW